MCAFKIGHEPIVCGVAIINEPQKEEPFTLMLLLSGGGDRKTTRVFSAH